MIISHKHKFIFIKPTKVAGTSIEVNLAKYCGDNDIITPNSNYHEADDEDRYEDYTKNNKGFYSHIAPKNIKKKISKKIWNDYYKFTIVRNPWDLIVSRYWYNNIPNLDLSFKKIFTFFIKNYKRKEAYPPILEMFWQKIYLAKIHDFKSLVKYFPEKFTNTRFYFDKAERPLCDFYIRYENLEEDYARACSFINIPYEKLPRLKTKFRKNRKKHYSEYYSEYTKNMVEQRFSREIDFFKYEFSENKEIK